MIYINDTLTIKKEDHRTEIFSISSVNVDGFLSLFGFLKLS